jgi:hypothetical protein
LLTREQFFAVKPEVREVSVPALGDSVYVRQISAGARDRLEAEQQKLGAKDFRARLVAAGACDAAGVPLFTEVDVARLSELPAHVLEDVAKAVVEVNKLSEADVDELEKN